MKELNFLLIMPRIVSTVGEGYNFPFGIAYISAVMKNSGLNVFNLNLNHIKGNIEEIISGEIASNKIDVVMTGGLSFQYNSLKCIVDCIHYGYPQTRIIIGGGIITGDPETAMIALEYADFGVIGEGELTAIELCKALQCNVHGEALSEIAGIIYVNNGKLMRTKPREEIRDLDSLPFPDYDGFGLTQYLEMPPMSINNVIKNRAFFAIGSRSCPFQCTFCFHTTGKKYRQRSIENLTKEIEMLVEKYNVSHIMFTDELFARKKERVQIIEEVSRKLNITWSASFRVDDINDELIELLKHGRCISMNLGLESASNKILKSMRKNTTVEQIDEALQLIYRAGIPTAGNFIFGDIEENIETVTETLDYWEKHREYNISLAYINVYPGTQLYKYALQNGIIKDAVQFLKDGCPQINVSKLSDDDLSFLTKKMFQLTGGGGGVLPNDCTMLLHKEGTGRITVKGKCIKCGKENIWENAKVLSSANWVNCADCGQKHLTPFPDELKSILFDNISRLCSDNQKIGLWGITKDSFVLFSENDIFINEDIFFVDNNSAQKQMIKIHDKKVYPPEELLVNKIDTVVFFYPSVYAVIAEEVKRKYPNVKNFINVYDLLIKK
jgi:radical SAM superfamily enzyme YgiQ (UPF0313 family)/DNA-directed RNA polymerase subunit RPC12/RpoP